MSIVRTVLGDISPDELGVVLPHEHLFFNWQGGEVDIKGSYDEDDLLAKLVKELAGAREAHGLTCLVDVTTSDCGRNMGLLTEASRRSGVHIVSSTGFYTESMGIPYYWQARPLDAVEEFFATEITEGALGTGSKCGIIKLATGPQLVIAGPTPAWGDELVPYALGPTKVEEKGFRAAARVQRKLGVAITTHTDSYDWAICNIGMRQLDVLLDEGADPSRCIIGHADGTSNIRYLAQIMDRGANVGVDMFAYSLGQLGDSARLGTITALVAMGYASQMILSHDIVLYEMRPPGTEADPSMYQSRNICRLFEEIIPALLKSGVSEDAIHQMTVENPRRLLAF